MSIIVGVVMVLLGTFAILGLLAVGIGVVMWAEDRKRRPVEQPKAEFGAIHTYYGGHEITKAVEDIWSPIETVIEAVEHQMMREARASKSYREDATLIYEGHPWMAFVRSGGAEYLGWSRDHVPGPSPVQRRRQNYGYVMSERGREAMTARPVRIGEEKPAVDLLEYMQKGLLEAGDVVPLIVSYDVDGRPIYDKRVSASTGKEHLRNASGKVVRTQTQSHVKREVKVIDPDSGEFLGSVGVCACGDCESEPWDDRLRNGG